MNWDDPEQRLALAYRVGVDEYNRLHAEHLDRVAVATVNGYRIRPRLTRFGCLFVILDRAFYTQGEAEAYARTLETLH